MNLSHLVIRSARNSPQALAVKDAAGSITYGELDRLANRFARALLRLGVRRGDRVGIWLEKSIGAVAAMQGALRLGAIYVPLDPLSPAARVYAIMEDCQVRVLVTTGKRADMALAQRRGLTCLCLETSGADVTWSVLLDLADDPLPESEISEQEIAYILYTSGSTGKPKGVCISHRNALAFIAWAAGMLQATASDRFANHAPFHFDLSVLDLYGAFSVGASVVLIPDSISFMPERLVNFLGQEEPTIWYSVPSVLVLMIEHGQLLAREHLPLRAILFAGEAFPITYFRQLYLRWPGIRFANLYGPTETNVCTFYEVDTLPEESQPSLPIGRACSGDRVWLQREDGNSAGPGEEGELLVSGPTVMHGYWGQEPHGERPYATGDLAYLREDGNYVYLGRRDHMLKIRGHRVEPAEIEAALGLHPAIQEAAVVVAGAGIAARLIAYVVPRSGMTPMLLQLKQHCAEHLPRYMIIDALRVLAALPRTRNGKVDRLALLHNETTKQKSGEH